MAIACSLMEGNPALPPPLQALRAQASVPSAYALARVAPPPLLEPAAPPLLQGLHELVPQLLLWRTMHGGIVWRVREEIMEA